MDKAAKINVVVILAGIIVISLLAMVIASKSVENITAAAVAGQKKCMNAKPALKFINEKGCHRIYDDPECEAKGKVEIQC